MELTRWGDVEAGRVILPANEPLLLSLSFSSKSAHFTFYPRSLSLFTWACVRINIARIGVNGLRPPFLSCTMSLPPLASFNTLYQSLESTRTVKMSFL